MLVGEKLLTNTSSLDYPSPSMASDFAPAAFFLRPSRALFLVAAAAGIQMAGSIVIGRRARFHLRGCWARRGEEEGPKTRS